MQVTATRESNLAGVEADALALGVYAGGSLSAQAREIDAATGASAIGVPGWPLLAASTASMASVRIVLIESWEISCLLSVAGVAVAEECIGNTVSPG